MSTFQRNLAHFGAQLVNLCFDLVDSGQQIAARFHPPLEQVTGPEKALELARLANDEMAELVAKYPQRFVAATARTLSSGVLVYSAG